MFRNGSRSQNLESSKKVALAPNSIKTKEEETMVIKSEVIQEEGRSMDMLRPPGRRRAPRC